MDTKKPKKKIELEIKTVSLNIGKNFTYYV